MSYKCVCPFKIRSPTAPRNLLIDLFICFTRRAAKPKKKKDDGLALLAEGLSSSGKKKR